METVQLVAHYHAYEVTTDTNKSIIICKQSSLVDHTVLGLYTVNYSKFVFKISHRRKLSIGNVMNIFLCNADIYFIYFPSSILTSLYYNIMPVKKFDIVWSTPHTAVVANSMEQCSDTEYELHLVRITGCVHVCTHKAVGEAPCSSCCMFPWHCLINSTHCCSS